MKIGSSFDKNDTIRRAPSFGAYPKNVLYIPESLGKLAQKAGCYINTPEQKLVLASTAVLLTPHVDLIFAKEDKKTDVAIKTTSKAIAGGITGVGLRALFIKLTTNCIRFDKRNNILSKLFMPPKAIKMKDDKPEQALEMLTQYNKTLGTLGAVIFMIAVTNKNVDVPLTCDIQDFITGIVKDNKTWTKSLSDVAQARKNKVKDWFKKKKSKFENIGHKAVKIGRIIVSKENDNHDKLGGKH